MMSEGGSYGTEQYYVSTSGVLPVRWWKPEGIAELWGEWEPLITAYRECSNDQLTVEELAKEMVATLRNDSGAVFVALNRRRQLTGYLCIRTMEAGREHHAQIVQWYKGAGSREDAQSITDSFFALARGFAKERNCHKIKLETRAVQEDGMRALPAGFRRMLERFGFKPVYVGLEAPVEEVARLVD